MVAQGLPVFLISLAIGSQRIEIGPDHRGNAATLGLSSNLAGSGLALTERFLESLDSYRQADLVAISEAIGDCLCDAEDLYGHALDGVGFDPLPSSRSVKRTSLIGVPSLSRGTRPISGCVGDAPQDQPSTTKQERGTAQSGY